MFDPKQIDPNAPTKPRRDLELELVKHRKDRGNDDWVDPDELSNEDEWVDKGELPDVIRGGEGQERAANTPEDEDDEVRQGT